MEYCALKKNTVESPIFLAHRTLLQHTVYRSKKRRIIENAKRCLYKMAFFVEFVVFFRPIDGLLCHGTVR
jgi:hypothetical protein